MPATLRSLFAEPRFGLGAVLPISDDVLDTAILTAHSTDLPDPTPWLESGQLLLTDGAQFRGGRTDPGGYVARLRERGILALGFATQVVHDVIPPTLVEACRKQQLPLFEVGQRAPFMAIIRHVADVLAEEQRHKLETTLVALRALARAALRPDGLAAILRELERNLGCWVAIYDAAGRRIEVPNRIPMPSTARDAVAAAVRRALEGRRPAGVRGTSEAGMFTLQTLGQGEQLRGVLAVGMGVTLDRAGNDLVESVIALASIALEQSRAVDDARRRLRSGVLELLHAGVLDVAGGAVRPLWGELPREPIRVAMADVSGGASDSLYAELELLADGTRGQVFFAERRGALLIVVPHDERDAVEKILAAYGYGAGYSAPTAWADFRQAEDEAERAARRLDGTRRFVTFESLAHSGIMGHLEVTGAKTLARRILLPLREEDSTKEGALERTIIVWLKHNGAWDPAARELGIHRHTLRAKINAAGDILGMDLSTFGARAEVWSALQLDSTSSPVETGRRPESPDRAARSSVSSEGTPG